MTGTSESGKTTRGASFEQFKLNMTPKTFISDATRLWNQAPIALKNAASISTAKTLAYCKSLQV